MAEPGRGRGKKVIAPRGKGRRTPAERAQISEAALERTKAARERYEQEQAKIARDAARKARESNRGRARGRGGYMGDSRAAPIAGPFSAGSVIGPDIGRGKAFPRPWAPSSATSGAIRNIPALIKHVKFENSIRPKTEGYEPMDLDAIREVQDGGYISSDPDEAEEGKRRNIDHIDIVSDDDQPAEEGTAAEASTKERIISPSMAPIRLYRREHRDRAPPKNPESGDTAVKKENVDEDVTTATDGTIVSAAKKGKQPEKDLEITGSSQSFQGVYSDDAAPAPPLIKEEPMEDVEEGTPAAGVFEDPKDILDVKPKRIHKLGPKHSAPVLNTAEDHAEYDRYQDDLQSLTHELRHATVNDAGELTEEDHKKERTYLFQFPPVVPDLVPQAPIVVKDEPVEEPAAAPTETAIADPVADPAAPIKIEDDAKDVSKRLPHLPKLASGLVGKMQVHKSGKVTLNWGGASLELHKGMDVTFLQDIVLVKRDNEVPQSKIAKGVVGGEAMAFGQVRGKFVVTPDWDDVLG